MGLLANLRFARQRARKRPTRSCSHLDQIRDVTPSSTGCQPCLELGDTWIHLRMCMTDGQVLCCDSSKNKHASGHAHQHAPTHQIVRSMEPGEDWLRSIREGGAAQRVLAEGLDGYGCIGMPLPAGPVRGVRRR